MTAASRVAMLERIAKYAREDHATTLALARALAELDSLPAEPDVVWVVTYETFDDSEPCGGARYTVSRREVMT